MPADSLLRFCVRWEGQGRHEDPDMRGGILGSLRQDLDGGGFSYIAAGVVE